ncbi:MAG: hypothetical protein ACYTEK_09865 [Planctomycetota bacterium]
MLCSIMRLSVLILILAWAVAPAKSASIAIENASFESPMVDPNGFPAFPLVDGWTEIDRDALGSTNTGVFLNTPVDSPDHVANAHGKQLAFLGSEQGNALEQLLEDTYKIGSSYRLTAGVAISINPLSQLRPDDAIEIALFYLDSNEPVDIAVEVVVADGLSSTFLQDFSAHLPTVEPGDAWAGKNIGLAIRAAGQAGGFWDMDNVRLAELLPVAIAIENASFESPVVDPNAFPALPLVDGWTETDNAPLGDSVNTGVFPNTEPNSFDHVINADGNQLAFLGSQLGNALEQGLSATYNTGCDYRLTVAVGVSAREGIRPVEPLELVLYYRDGNEPVDIVSRTVTPMPWSQLLEDFSVYLPTVTSGDAWAGRTIGVTIRATGIQGGFWVLDNVRLAELLPVSIPIENASFESPVVDPNGFGAFPMVDGWAEIDVDGLGSTNTGVFANTAAGSEDHIVNADGDQLAFLGSQSGNALEQDLASTYKAGCDYRLTVGVGISGRFPPSSQAPVGQCIPMMPGPVRPLAWPFVRPVWPADSGTWMMCA